MGANWTSARKLQWARMSETTRVYPRTLDGERAMTGSYYTTAGCPQWRYNIMDLTVCHNSNVIMTAKFALIINQPFKASLHILIESITGQRVSDIDNHPSCWTSLRPTNLWNLLEGHKFWEYSIDFFTLCNVLQLYRQQRFDLQRRFTNNNDSKVQNDCTLLSEQSIELALNYHRHSATATTIMLRHISNRSATTENISIFTQPDKPQSTMSRSCSPLLVKGCMNILFLALPAFLVTVHSKRCFGTLYSMPTLIAKDCTVLAALNGVSICMVSVFLLSSCRRTRMYDMIHWRAFKCYSAHRCCSPHR